MNPPSDNPDFSPPATSTSRREWLFTALAAAAGAIAAGCQKARPSMIGDLFMPGMNFGHQIRDRSTADRLTIDSGSNEAAEEIEVAIVGAGIAGLSAAWQLLRSGVTNIRVFELETEAGGTSRSGQSPVTAFPWGAHYVPMPDAGFTDLIDLFVEMGAVRKQADGSVEAVEGVACREPEERLFDGQQWIDDLYPRSHANEQDLAEWDRFKKMIQHWIDWRDSNGRRAFAIPTAECSRDPEVMALDQVAADKWLTDQGFTSKPLRWLVDYCCRDDYGLNLENSSAWSALFYFASRLSSSSQPEPPLLTWPAGNGAIVNHLKQVVGDRLTAGQPVMRISAGDLAASKPAMLSVWDSTANKSKSISAKHLIFAAPQFVSPHVIANHPDERTAAVKSFSYGAWVVANIHLSDRPASVGAPLSWDNVFWNSPSLGYVVATHQLGSDYGPTVWTWYYPMFGANPSKDRAHLLASPWSVWAEVVLADLAIAHPDIADLIQRIDIMFWGHAMIQPRPGFISSLVRDVAAKPLGNIHFANTDLSGVPLMEEAFYHGLRAAREIIATRDANHVG